ncbi:hypothetical protein ACWNMU_17765, partial [Escherichia fergusonii]
MDETTDKEKAGNQPACLDLYSLSFQLTNYVTKTLSNLTVCFEQEAEVGSFVDCPHKSDYRNSCNS